MKQKNRLLWITLLAIGLVVLLFYSIGNDIIIRDFPRDCSASEMYLASFSLDRTIENEQMALDALLDYARDSESNEFLAEFINDLDLDTVEHIDMGNISFYDLQTSSYGEVESWIFYREDIEIFAVDNNGVFYEKGMENFL